MKIGVDVSQTCAERAGCAWWADAVARALALQPEVELSLYHRFGDWIDGCIAAGTVIAAAHVASPLWGMAPAEARTFWELRERGEPLPDAPDFVLACGFHAPRTPGAKLLYVVHDLVFLSHPEFSSSGTRLIYQEQLLLALSRAAGLLFTSDFVRREFESVLPGWLAETGRPWTIAAGASRFAAAEAIAPREPNAPWLFVGSIEPRKNVAALLDAYEQYAAGSPRPRPLVLAGGTGWKSDAVHRRLHELASRLPVVWRGYVTEADLLRLYRTSFALVRPSWHDGFGLPVVEAMGQGLPVIAANAGALPETCGGATAALVAPDDSRALAAALLALDADSMATARAAAAGLRRAADFSWERTARTILEFARSLA